MKRILFFVAISFALNLGLQAQSLDGTEWRCHDKGTGLAVFEVLFWHDTVHVEINGGQSIPFSLYWETGTDFKIWDFNPTSACNPADTGYYSFEISNDTLIFSVPEDACSVRVDNFTNFHWVQTALNVEELKTEISIEVYPNPASEWIYVQIPEYALGQELIILDALGQHIHTFTAMSEKERISISHLPAGIYFLQFEDQKEAVTKFVKR